VITPVPLVSLWTLARPVTLTGWMFATQIFVALDVVDLVDVLGDGEAFGLAEGFGVADGCAVGDADGEGLGEAAMTTAPPRMSAPIAPNRPNLRIPRLLSTGPRSQASQDRRFERRAVCPAIGQEGRKRSVSGR